MLKCYVIWVLLSLSSCPWYVRPICNSEVRESIESSGFEHKNLTLCRRYWNTMYWWLTFSFFVASQKAAVGDVVGFSGLLPRGLRAPRTGRAEMSSRKSGAERGKVGFFYPSQVHILQLQCWCNLLWNWNWGVRDSEKLFHRCNFFDLK